MKTSLIVCLVLCPAVAFAGGYPPLPTAVSSFGAATCDGYVYVYGGHSGPAHTYSTEDILGTFHRVKVGGGEWEALPGGPKLQGLALVAGAGRKLYRVGGTEARNPVGEKSDLRSVKSVACFDPQSKKWSELPDLPVARSSHDASIVGDRLFVAGGWEMRGKGEDSVWHDVALSLDLSAKEPKWEAFKQPFQRRALTTAALDGKLYVVGGLSPDGLTAKVDVYDTKSKEWAEGPKLEGNRMNGFSPAACVVDGRLLVNPSDGEMYALSGDGWKNLGVSLEKKRFVHRMVAGDGKLIVLGGASRSGNVAETEQPPLGEK